MARKKKGIGLFRILVLIFLLVLIVLVLVLILKKNVTLEKDQEEVKKEEVQVNINEEVKISCNKYDVYFDKDDKLGFNFIIAELNFVNNNNSSLYYDLKNLYTGEKIKLNDVESYLAKLQAFNYDVKKFNLLGYEFNSEGGSLSGNVFIPFLKDYTSLSIYNGEEIQFDLTKNKHYVDELLYDVQTEDIKTDKYDIRISDSYTENTFITSDTGEEFPCPLALVFELYVQELSSSNVYIETAKFIPDGSLSGETLAILLDDHVDSYKIKNVINKKLKTGDKYGLFFQVSEQTPETGKIMIKFSDNEKWIEISVGE